MKLFSLMRWVFPVHFYQTNVAAALVAASVVGGVASSRAAKKSAKAMEATPEEREAVRAQTQLARDEFEYAKQFDAQQAARQERMDRTVTDIAGIQKIEMEKGIARGDEMYDYYRTVGRPAIDRAMDEAQTWDRESTLGGLRGQAYADIEHQAGVQRDIQARDMQRMGVNPLDGRYQSMLAQTGVDTALAKVQAANALIEGRKATGANLRVNAANMANGFQGQGLAQSGYGMQAGQGAVGTTQAGVGSGIASGQAGVGMLRGAGASFGAAGGAMRQGRALDMQRESWLYNAQAQNMQNMGTGVAMGYNMYAGQNGLTKIGSIK